MPPRLHIPQLHSLVIKSKLPTAKMSTKPSRRLKNPALFICDIQEKFRPVVWEYASIISTTQKLLRFASILSIPIYATTQNSARLGPTCPELSLPFPSPSPSPSPSPNPETLNGNANTNANGSEGNGKGGMSMNVVEHTDKTAFSMWIPEISRHFQGEKAEIVIVGIESHICVTQTALDALGAEHRVYIIADGVSSCNREEIPIALARLRGEGAVITSSESFMYECMGDAALGEFKDVARLVKECSGVTREVVGTLLSKM